MFSHVGFSPFGASQIVLAFSAPRISMCFEATLEEYIHFSPNYSTASIMLSFHPTPNQSRTHILWTFPTWNSAHYSIPRQFIVTPIGSPLSVLSYLGHSKTTCSTVSYTSPLHSEHTLFGFHSINIFGQSLLGIEILLRRATGLNAALRATFMPKLSFYCISVKGWHWVNAIKQYI